MANSIGPSLWTVKGLMGAVFNGKPFVVNGLYMQAHNGLPGSDGTANVIADTDRQVPSFSEGDDNAFVQTIGAPMEYTLGEIADLSVSHFSLWTALSGGDFVWNLVATKPIPVVEGDLLIISDGVTLQLDGWV